ncbi:MAG TPA: UDP-N-acetylmuramoyl-tripeptide--D-alanyl-D-alanine ligase [Labilithrix sp.]|nr:UDP-N-acetylmuramoyl-tripeptide--D-alanyl-D-alanine ligase [Labilithrix sp.]
MATPIPSNRAALTLDAIVLATRGTIARQGSATSIVGITTDSRAVLPGGLFVALRGESHDGHRFVETAAARGAAAAVVERGRASSFAAEALAGMSLVEVDDSLVAFGDLARVHLEAWRAGASEAHPRRVIAITGSAGKTTTKELTAALVAAVGPTHRTAGNLNNRIGVPSVVLGILEEHDFAVVEMGMSLPGELDAITAFARPDVSLVTNVGLAHAEGVGGPDGVMREKGAVYRALDEGGVAVVNADDPRVIRAAQGTRAGLVVTFGTAESADYRLAAREPAPGGGSLVTIVCSEESVGLAPRILSIDLALPGEAAALDLAAALAAQEAASGVRLTALQIEAALANLRLDGRATVQRLGQDIVVLDDTYNANPASMRAALQTLAELAGPRRRVVVLGEMKELGAHAESEHDALGEALAGAGVAVAIGCGGLIDRTLARAAELSPITVVRAASTDEATRKTLGIVRPGDAVLVKGSRSVGAERVVAALTETWPSADLSATSVLK